MSETSQKQGAATGKGNGGGPRRRRIVLVIALLFVAGLAYVGYSYWIANLGYESTDDAYLDGNAITIAPRISGAVVSLDIQRQSVRP